MTPQRWKGAGIVFLVITVVLIIAAVASVFLVGISNALPTYGPSTLPDQVVPAGVFGVADALLRGVVLGAFAGVTFFLGLTCFLWSGVVEAKEQRAEILLELTALRASVEEASS